MRDLSNNGVLPITSAQIRAIRGRQHHIGMDDPTYRELLARDYNVASTRDLTRNQANQLLGYLHGGRPKRTTRPGRRQPIKTPADPVRPQPQATGSTVYRLPTRRQHQLIAELRGEIAWRAKGGYERWLDRSLGITTGGPRTSYEAARVINGLMGLKRHDPL